MPERDESVTGQLSRIRQLQAARDHRGVVDALDGMARAELLAEPALGYALAVAQRALGRAGEALELTRALREPCARRGRDRLFRRRLNLEAALEFERGQLARAADVWQELLNEATEAEDNELMAMASNNLGILHTLAGRSWEALAAYSRALMANQRLGDRRGLAQAHQNLAITFREVGFGGEAHSHFEEALAHAKASGGADVLGRAEEERALLFLLNGDAGMAEASARRALDRLGGIGDVAGEAEALRVLGLIALSQGRTDEARSRLDDALERSRTVGIPLLEAETLEALAGVERSLGDADAASRLADAADRLFREMGAEMWGEQIRQRVAEFTPDA